MSLRTLTLNDRTAPEAYVIASLVQGEWERALELIDELGPAPAYAPHLSTVAARLLDERQTTAALRIARRAVELDPNCAAAQSILGRGLLEATDDAAHGPASGNVAESAIQVRGISSQLHQSTNVTRAPTVSLCLITRDEAGNLPRVIESVRGLVTEIIVVDTGSTDDTLKVAQRLKARVAQLAWEDDFAAARNYSLSLATGEWVLVLDADDEFSRESIASLGGWLSREPEADVVGLYRRYPTPEMQRESISVQPRLFRNGRGLRFKGAIHEELVTADGCAAQPDITLTATIYHHGAIDGPGATARRRERNGRILRRVLEREPDNIRCRFYLGLTQFEGERWNEAIPALQAVIDQPDVDLDFLPKAYACLGNALLNAHRPLQAETAIRAGLARFPLHPELWFCLGLVSDHLGRLEEAIEANEAALRGRFGPSLNWHDWACRESKPHFALCDLKLTLGDTEGATRHLAAAERFSGPAPAYAQIRKAIARTKEEQARRAADRNQSLAECKARFAAGDRAAGGELVGLLLAEGQVELARLFVDEWLKSDADEPWVMVAHGSVLLASGSPDQALDQFVCARRSCPAQFEAWIGVVDALWALNRPDEAEIAVLEALQQVTERDKLNRVLGELYLARRRWEEATRCFQQCLEKSDDDWSAWLGLGKALLRSGNLPSAIDCYQRAASLSGGGAAVRVALGEARELLARQAASAG